LKKIDLGQTIGILANVGVIAGILFLGIALGGRSIVLPNKEDEGEAALER
jgi:hypothetical protein